MLSAVFVHAQAVQSYGGLVALVVLGLLYTVFMVPAGLVVCCCRCCCQCCKLCGGRHPDYDGSCSRCTRRVCGGLLILTAIIATYAPAACSSPLLLYTLTSPPHSTLYTRVYSLQSTVYTLHSTLHNSGTSLSSARCVALRTSTVCVLAPVSLNSPRCISLPHTSLDTSSRQFFTNNGVN